MAEKKYIEVETAIENAISQMRVSKSEVCMRERLLNMPAADVRPVVRGEWIWKKSCEVVCSKCNDLMAIVGNTEDLITVKSYHNFCPNCGADMRERKEKIE